MFVKQNLPNPDAGYAKEKVWVCTTEKAGHRPHPHVEKIV
jgi:hypothetical protein